MNIHINSLGCRLNQSEIQSIITVLKQSGHKITTAQEAEIFIINSCVVTHTSERKTRTFIHNAQRNAGEAGFVIVTGCFAKSYSVQGNTIYLSNDYKYLIPDLINNDFILPENAFRQDRFSFQPAIGSTRTRINLKIQDGCDNFCSYCIIPYVRGNPVSRSMESILKEFSLLLDKGYHEFLLTGVMISNYNDGANTLADLLKNLLDVEGDYRIHLSSISPQTIDDRLIQLLFDKRMVRHLHLSLQSGSDSILKLMNRQYTIDRYLNILHQIRSIDKYYNFTTDLIVGFPGENNKEFDETLNTIKIAAFSHIHTFRYSKRQGTAAALLKDQTPEEVKKERSNQVIELSDKLNRKYQSLFDNKITTILTENSCNDKTRGYNNYYIPILLKANNCHNQFITLRCKYDKNSNILYGHPV